MKKTVIALLSLTILSCSKEADRYKVIGDWHLVELCKIHVDKNNALFSIDTLCVTDTVYTADDTAYNTTCVYDTTYRTVSSGGAVVTVCVDANSLNEHWTFEADGKYYMYNRGVDTVVKQGEYTAAYMLDKITLTRDRTTTSEIYVLEAYNMTFLEKAQSNDGCDYIKRSFTRTTTPVKIN